MLFNSFKYLIFYFLFFILFYSIKNRKSQILLICIGSLYFYAAWNISHVILLFLVCLIAYSVQLSFFKQSTPWLQIVLALGILFVFKYFNFFAHELIYFNISLNTVNLILPVGISFYVFQAISYIVDKQRMQVKSVSLQEVVAYISFFPQLVAGPIVRADVFLPQLARRLIFDKKMFYTGILLFSMGMFKKVVIADNMGLFADSVFDISGGTTAGNHILAFYFYAIQIYYDFCGYSDMAIGIARTLGFKFPANFNRPYFSASITQFWKRWHISLSGWLRDYLYISLGGNQRGRFRLLLNLALVMLIGGLWHGAAWTFIIWGGFHGLLLAVERLFSYNPQDRVSRIFGIIITFHLVALLWILFRSADIASAITFIKAMTDIESMAIITSKFIAVKCLFLVVIFILIEFFSNLRTFFFLRRKKNVVLFAIVYSFLFLLFGNFSETPFIYFQF